ncbi:MAG: hypothetical protein KatS3mg027_2155 [Bacteroidia bacterium]|nr:MAG: hypothetical protein KatS3mg027_2155 [Bacteroidia bacterium]
MKTSKNFVFNSLILGTFILSSAFIIKWSSGIPGRTGSPGETTCTACHGGGTGTTNVSISATPNFSANEYIPGNTYTINVTVTNNSYTKFGFGCEILDPTSNSNAGTMNTPLTGVQFLTASNGRNNAVHTTPKTGSGTTTFSFIWTAPTTTNNIVIYAAGNAVNGNGTTTGDAVGSASLVLTANTTSIKENTANNSMLIFPNPASDFISIHVDYFNTPTDVTLELYDLKGIQHYTLINTKLNYGQNEIKTFLPTEVSNGLYLLKIRSNEKTIASQLFLVKK